jgi:hypothetical protein
LNPKPKWAGRPFLDQAAAGVSSKPNPRPPLNPRLEAESRFFGVFFLTLAVLAGRTGVSIA